GSGKRRQSVQQSSGGDEILNSVPAVIAMEGVFPCGCWQRSEQLFHGERTGGEGTGQPVRAFFQLIAETGAIILFQQARHTDSLLPFYFSNNLPALLFLSFAPEISNSCGDQVPLLRAEATRRRLARNSLTLTVFAFKSSTSAISSIENPSTSFSTNI